ncbi:PIF1-like helicase [Medicago truncatula]|uniref:PIF1-like helicase n=1 Tax=Medicago truncatula TaxID=3880 RepID=G7KRT3_MEDTR|nr:PIF1-like helicase [Medicago truncatula]
MGLNGFVEERIEIWRWVMKNDDDGGRRDRAILTPKNVIVDEINNYVMSLIPGEERIYLSCDSPCPSSIVANRPDDVHTPKFLNTISASGLPNHKIILKVEVPIMLLRNLDISVGLCNETRLIITRIGRYMLEGRVISGSSIGDKVYVPCNTPFSQHKNFITIIRVFNT